MGYAYLLVKMKSLGQPEPCQKSEGLVNEKQKDIKKQKESGGPGNKKQKEDSLSTFRERPVAYDGRRDIVRLRLVSGTTSRTLAASKRTVKMCPERLRGVQI